MSATSALDEMLSMVKRRALEISALPIDRREGRYEMIHDATRRASISIGQQPADAAVSATAITQFVRAVVGILDTGARSDGQSAGHPHIDSPDGYSETPR
jgi:hypothetical protein